jgi:hypothetical protein
MKELAYAPNPFLFGMNTAHVSFDELANDPSLTEILILDVETCRMKACDTGSICNKLENELRTTLFKLKNQHYDELSQADQLYNRLVRTSNKFNKQQKFTTNEIVTKTREAFLRVFVNVFKQYE